MRAANSSSIRASSGSVLLRCIRACAKWRTARGLATITSTTGRLWSSNARVAGRLQADAHPATLASQVTRQGSVAFPGVGKRLQRQRLLVPAQRHQQLILADFNTGKITLVHNGLLGVGWSSGSPTLYNLLRSSLYTQAHKASDSPRPGRRGRGADLPSRLSILANRASATGGLPAGTTPSTPVGCNTKIKIQATARFLCRGSLPDRNNGSRGYSNAKNGVVKPAALSTARS